jgi:hypothetical protein
MGTPPTFTAGQVVPASALAFLADPPHMSATASVAQPLPDSTFTGVVLQNKLEDNDGMFNPGDAKVTIKTPGRWLFTYMVPFGINPTGSRYAGLLRNGSAIAFEVHRLYVGAAGGSQSTDLSTATILRCALNDTIQLTAYQSSGGALNTYFDATNYARFSAHWLGK